MKEGLTKIAFELPIPIRDAAIAVVEECFPTISVSSFLRACIAYLVTESPDTVRRLYLDGHAREMELVAARRDIANCDWGEAIRLIEAAIKAGDIGNDVVQYRHSPELDCEIAGYLQSDEDRAVVRDLIVGARAQFHRLAGEEISRAQLSAMRKEVGVE